MDTIIEDEVVSQKRKKRLLIAGLIIITLIATIWLLRTYFKTSLTTADFTTARVEVGMIENTINATGEVLPEFEEIIASPINASIKNVLMDAGNKVNKGQSILTLDKSVTQTDYEKLRFQRESKENEIRKSTLR